MAGRGRLIGAGAIGALALGVLLAPQFTAASQGASRSGTGSASERHRALAPGSPTAADRRLQPATALRGAARGPGVSTSGLPGGLDVSACPSSTGRPVRQAPGSGRTVALTFDDGPGAATAQVLDELAAAQVHATFFVVGREAKADPGMVTRAADGGNLIGNHTWDHRYPRTVPGGWSARYLRSQIGRDAAEVATATGHPTCFFRPPGGFLPASVGQVSRQLHQQVVLWSVDTRDWAIEGPGRHGPGHRSTAQLANQIYAAAVVGVRQQHPIILMHDGGGWRQATALALPRIIAFYRAHGYTFVRLDGLT